MTDDTLFPDTALLSKEEDQSCLRKQENVKLPFSILLFSGNLKEFSCDNFQRQIPRTKKRCIRLVTENEEGFPACTDAHSTFLCAYVCVCVLICVKPQYFYFHVICVTHILSLLVQDCSRTMSHWI